MSEQWSCQTQTRPWGKKVSQAVRCHTTTHSMSGQALQKEDGLVLGAVPQSQEGALCQVIGSVHSTRVAGAIALGGCRVRVDAHEGMGGQTGTRDRNMEAAGEVGGDLGVGLKMGGQRGQRRLRVSTAASPAQRRDRERHGDGIKNVLMLVSTRPLSLTDNARY